MHVIPFLELVMTSSKMSQVKSFGVNNHEAQEY
jgi:hypothetical protein